MPGETKPCGSCGAPVLWLRNTTTGKAGPINAEPEPASAGVRGGNIAVDLAAGTYTVIAEPARWPYLGMLHTNHFTDCPQRASWAKRGGQRDTRRRGAQ